MREIAVFVAACSIATVPIAPAQAIEIDAGLLWHACPYLVDTIATAALRRLDLPLETIGPIADYACNVAQSYQSVSSNPPGPNAQDDPQTADEIFCEGSSLDYCAGVRGVAPMSFAYRCWIQGLSMEQCVVNAIQSRAN